MPVTIFEGPDGAGKTTLTGHYRRWLANDRRYIAHPTNHGPYIGMQEIATYYLGDLLLGLPNRQWHVLMDRAWQSESVYGPLIRGVDRITIAQRRCLERVALAASTVTILCLPPFEVCLKAYNSRRELEYLHDNEALRRVHQGFKDLWDMAYRHDNTVKYPVPMVAYDWTGSASNTTIKDLVEVVRPKINEGPGVGHWNPGGVTLMVGEQINRGTAAAILPFTSWHPGGCVSWLSEQLEEHGIGEDQLYWINALDDTGADTDPEYWLDKLQPKKIIAMGMIATAWARRHGLTSIDVDHPQYWKRFNSKKPYPLMRHL